MSFQRASAILLVVFCLAALGGREADPIATRVDRLFAQLGDPEWKQRESAQAALAQLGKDHHDMILERGIAALTQSDDPERSHRLGQVLRDLLLTYRFGSGKGFLGVRLDSERNPLKVGDQEYFPIRIAGLLPDTPAASSGFKVNDQIVKLDDKVCHLGFDVADLVDYISSRTPGTNMTVVLYSEDQLTTQQVILAKRPSLETDPPIELQKEAFFQEWLKRNLRRARSNKP